MVRSANQRIVRGANNDYAGSLPLIGSDRVLLTDKDRAAGHSQVSPGLVARDRPLVEEKNLSGEAASRSSCPSIVRARMRSPCQIMLLYLPNGRFEIQRILPFDKSMQAK